MDKRFCGLFVIMVLLTPVLTFGVMPRHESATVQIPSETTTPVVHLHPFSSTVFVEYNATIYVNVTNVSNLYGCDFKLNYNTTFLNTTEVSLGSVFDPVHSFFWPNVDEDQGLIRVVATNLLPATPFTGSGTLAKITFLGVTEGLSTLNLSDTLLSDSSANPIAHVSFSGGARIEEMFASREVLLAFKPETTPEDIQLIYDNYGLETIYDLTFIETRQLKIVSNHTVREMVSMLSLDSHVEFAEPNYVESVDSHLTEPNDPFFGLQWGLNNGGQRILERVGTIDADVDAPQAWEHMTQADKIVAIIDTGADLEHLDLAANIWVNPLEVPGDGNGDHAPGVAGVDDDNDRWGPDHVQGTADDEAEQFTEDGIDNDTPPDGLTDENGIDFRDVDVMQADYDRDGVRLVGPDGRFGTADDDADDVAWAAQDDDESGFLDDYNGADFVNNDQRPQDDYGHGTHVAGIIGAVGNNGYGTAGVVWGSRFMMILKAGGVDGSLEIDDCVRAIHYAIEHGAEVISISSGSYFYNANYRRAIDRAEAAHVIIVASAGNNGVDVDVRPRYPACYPNSNIVSVAASDNRDNLAAWRGPRFIDEIDPSTGAVLPHEQAQEGSNFGISNVDLAAPGLFIYSTMPRASPPNDPVTMFRELNWDRWQDANGDGRVRWTDLNGNHQMEPNEFDEPVPFFSPEFDYMSGTSMAAPFVSGTIVHFWSLFPTLTHDEVIHYLERWVDPRPGIAGRVKWGKDAQHDARLRMIMGDDFGDAPDQYAAAHQYPTKTRYLGAGHEDIGEEWLGGSPTGDVSPEFDADVLCDHTAPQAQRHYDADHIENIMVGRIPANPEPPYNAPCTTPNQDAYDDGIMFLTPFDPGQKAMLSYCMRTEHEDVVDAEGGRYVGTSALAPDKNLHMNIWIDWNYDGDWEDSGEHVFYKRHNPTTEWNGAHCSGWKIAEFLVPLDTKIGIPWLRARLDYGENRGLITKYDSGHPDAAHLLERTKGLAQYGEVEDYICPPPSCVIIDPPFDGGWVMYGYDAARTRYISIPGPCSNNTIWTYSGSGPIMRSSPAIADGKVFIGSTDSKVYAINAETGQQVWNYTTGNWISSSPAVVSHRVYIGSSDGNLYCLNATNGGLLWKFVTAPAGSGILSSPVVVEGVVYVGSADKNLYALNAITGNLVWKITVAASIYSSPAVANGKIFFCSYDGFLHAADIAYRNITWSQNIQNTGFSSPAVSDGKVYVGSTNGKVYCFDCETGNQAWNFATMSTIESSPAVTCGKVFIGSYDGKAYALNASDGSLVWSVTTIEPIYSAPVVACKQKVYFSTMSGTVYSIEIKTANVLWKCSIGDSIQSSLAMANGVLYVPSYSGKITALRSLHDISVTNVTPSKTVALIGYTASINVTVRNLGDFPETFSVMICANSSVIQTLPVSLAKAGFSEVTFTWNTTGLPRGRYSISVDAILVQNELKLQDNYWPDFQFTLVRLVGDVNGDNKVDLKDVFMVGKAYGSRPGFPNWNPNCDINNDGKIDLKDYFVTCKNFGKVDP